MLNYAFSFRMKSAIKLRRIFGYYANKQSQRKRKCRICKKITMKTHIFRHND